jgi:uncharacterized membrane protein (UPF0127 family)
MPRKKRTGEGRTILQNRELKKRLPPGKALFFLVFSFYLFCLPTGLVSQDSSKPFLELKIGERKIKVEVVRTEAEKARGLMFRQKLGRDEGMLFVYEKEERLSFWMKNTPIPLSIAFLDKTGMVVDIQDLVPFSLQTRISAFPAQYALEVDQGWFKTNGISIGDTVTFPAGFAR